MELTEEQTKALEALMQAAEIAQQAGFNVIACASLYETFENVAAGDPSAHFTTIFHVHDNEAADVDADHATMDAIREITREWDAACHD